MEVSRPAEASYLGSITFEKVPLVLQPAELAGVDVAIVGAPMDDLVSSRPGTRFGPRAIRVACEAGGPPSRWHMDLGIDPFSELRIVDYSDAQAVPGDAYASHKAIQAMVDEVVTAGAVPFVLGGDHSIAYPDISSVVGPFDEGSIAVVQFDAHADTATELWGVKWSHGTPFRHLVDEGHIPGHRLVQVGLRGHWPYPEEWAWARDNGVRWHRMEEIVERGVDSVVDDVLREIHDAPNLFISLDIDALDPAYAPGTGTPEIGGMTSREMVRALRRLIIAKGLVGFEIVEVSPPYDHAEITAYAAHSLVLEALAALALHRSGKKPTPETPH